MTNLFRLGQYVRINRHVWYSLTCGVQVTDTHEIAQLEAEYKIHQRSASAPHSFTPRQRIGTPPRIERSKGQVTPRESRGKGRVE